MPWSEFEAHQILSSVNDWPGKLGDSAWGDWSEELCRYQALTVRDALKQIRRTQEKNTRPALRQVVEQCERLCRTKYSEKHGDVCPWCEGRQLIRIRYYRLSLDEAAAAQIPASMTREIAGGCLAVDQRVGREIGAECVDTQAACGHCRPTHGYKTVAQAEESLGRFLSVVWSADAEIYKRCLGREPPPPIERVTMREAGIVVSDVVKALSAT